jgi:PAS domain S-box-containing protein
MSGAEEELRVSVDANRELATAQTGILDSIPANIALLDPAGVIVTVNKAWRTFGVANGLRASDPFLGVDYLAVCDGAVGDHAEEAALAAAGIRTILAGTEAGFALEYPCHSAAARRWFRLTASPLGVAGEGGAVVMHQDISARKFAEFAAVQAADAQGHLMAELAREQARLITAQAVAKVGSWETDLRTLAAHWSAEVYRIFGVDPATFTPDHLTFLAHCHPDDRAAVEDAFQSSFGNRDLQRIEHRIILSNGVHRHVEERWRTVVDALGAPTRAIGTCQDVTERHQAKLAVEEGGVLLRAAAKLSRLGAFRVDLVAGTGRWSDEVSAIHDFPPGYIPTIDEAIDKFSAKDAARMRAYHDACATEGTPYDTEVQIITHLGRRVWVRTIGEAVRDADGTIVAIQGAFQDITERRDIAESLRLSEERFRRIFDSAPMGIVITSLDGLLIETNAAFRSMLGRTSEELRGVPFIELTHADDRAASLEAAGLATKGGRETVTFNKRYLAADGRIVRGRVSVATPRDVAGHPLYFITVVEDITATHEAQESLAASEERFRLLSKAANDAIYDWNIAANATWYNEGYGRTYGLDDLSLGGTAEGWARLVHDEDRDHVWSSLQAALASTTENWSAEYRLRRGDGGYAHVLDRGYIVRDQEGRATRMIGAHTDLTSRREVQLRLTQQAALLDAAGDAILVKDVEGRITYWNKGAERCFGWLAAEVLGRSAAELFQIDPVMYKEARALLLAQDQWEGELTERGRDGQERQLSVRWTLVRDKHGAPNAVLSIKRDITAQRRLEMQLLRAQRLESLGTLAGGIAHDLNNVLAPILASIELLRIDDADPDRLESLATIEASAQRGAAMVQQVLTFARGVEGKRIPVDIGRIGQDAAKICRDTFPKGITHRLTVAPDLWSVNGDATQIHQVVMNLAVNARDAMPGGGALTVTLANVDIDEVFARMDPDARVGRYVAITVSDSGAGIPPQVQQRLFEPFFTTKEVGRGTGLGLSTVHTIVRSHGGFIDVYSEVGLGARFTVYLPALSDGQSPVAEAPHEVRLPRGNGEQILVVDDEASIRSVVQRTLERFGYRVMLAADGAEGLAAFTEHRRDIEVILTDMAMPVMDGPDMIEAILKVDPKARIVASSGLASGGAVADAMAAGVTDFVIKPYTAETLLMILDQALRRGKARRSNPPPMPVSPTPPP